MSEMAGVELVFLKHTMWPGKPETFGYYDKAGHTVDLEFDSRDEADLARPGTCWWFGPEMVGELISVNGEWLRVTEVGQDGRTIRVRRCTAAEVAIAGY